MDQFQSEAFGELQRLVDSIFLGKHRRGPLDLVVQAEILDLDPDLLEIVSLVPRESMSGSALCDQLNSALAAHGWGSAYGTVE